ncbi:ABC-2 type transport system ATP-binding protein [Thermoactinomyces sp. DSM 45891]|uniref:ABC transporter ATP-binding protein n=1 Tax=Thermoactinomyces sp. DSM 45891 TaxID=1761907 RepID=UPI00090F6E92|nr:ABC transporter ATP-binding protein [Thermoactinomyces sp. DSM 45891]SFX50891.1 ABC-2 type transport system ATP-binding protein [Thermoactinomyces sp. DSM 45891]
MTQIPMIEFSQVSKRFKKHQVLTDINLSIHKGEVIGIVGMNGSGKTTLLRLITGLMYASSGKVTVNGDIVQPGLLGQLPTSVGALIEAPSFLPQYTGLQNLLMLAGIQEKIDKQTVMQSMERVGLDPNNKKKVRAYSLGMRQRLGIAQSFMESPDILLYDEPTNGLDEQGVQMFKELIRDSVKREAAIILVSHVKEEIEQLCDKVYLIENGTLSVLREQLEKRWAVELSSFQEFEKLYKLSSSVQISSHENGNPVGIIQGEWASEEELGDFLRQNEILFTNIEGMHHDHI